MLPAPFTVVVKYGEGEWGIYPGVIPVEGSFYQWTFQLCLIAGPLGTIKMEPYQVRRSTYVATILSNPRDMKHPVPACDILVDGFLANTFSPQDANTFFALLLKTPGFLQYYRVTYSRGVWYITQNVPHVQRPSVGIQTQNPPLALDFSVKETQGTVVPQRRWFPGDEVDFRRFVIEAALQLPIFFVNRNGGVGFWLPDILHCRDHDLYNRDSEASLGGVTTTHIRINVSLRNL